MPFAAIYTRVSSELQEVDLSISAQEGELRSRAEKDGWTVCENALEPVVKREVWDQVQKLMEVSKRGRRWNEENHRAYLLTGSLYCSICGKYDQRRT